MKTAVIVSGALRYLPEASSSWKFNADYFLCVDSSIYEPQDPDSKGPIDFRLCEHIRRSKVQFKSITISQFQSDSRSLRNTALKMAWKWKIAYNSFIPYHNLNRYEKIILTRPDLYISSDNYEKLELKSNSVHIARPPHIDEKNSAWVDDNFTLMSPDIFRKLSGFYEFLVDAYKSPEGSVLSIHNHLYNFYSINFIAIHSSLPNFSYCPIRENCLALFDGEGNLGSGKTMEDLSATSLEWWKEKWKT